MILLLSGITLSTQVNAQGISTGSTFPLISESFQDVTGKSVRLSDLAGSNGTVVVFWSNECPWTSKAESRVTELARTYSGQGIGFILVNSNDPVAFPKENAESGSKKGYSVPYIMDSGSRLANAFGAERMPHFYVFDGNNSLVYAGAIDDSPGDPSNVRDPYLKNALDAVASGSEVGTPVTKSFGCMIKP